MGLLPPYYGIDFAVRMKFGLLEDIPEERCRQSSYLLKSLVHCMVRNGDRTFLSAYWREISFMHFEQFVVVRPENYLLMQTEEGENRTEIPKPEKSWAELAADTEATVGNGIPSVLKRFPEFLPFFISVFPFRANAEVIGYIEQALT